MIYFFKRKYNQIINVIKWIPIIWNQYNFDYSYSIEVFKHQLSQQAEYLESNKAKTVDAKNIAKRIRSIITLMTNVYNNKYENQYVEELKNKYGQNVLNSEIINNEIKYEYENWPNKNHIELDRKIFIKQAKQKQLKAHKLLWKLIEYDIQNWWA